MAEARKVKAHFALFAVTVFYSLNFVVAQDVMKGGFVPPLAFVFFRVFGAGLLFWLIQILVVKEKIIRRDIPYFILCSFIGIFLAQFSFFLGLEKTPTINASLLVCLTPIFVAVFSAFILKEKMTPYIIGGLLLAGSGAIVLLTHKGNFQFNQSYFSGNLLIIVNAITYGLYLVLIKPLVNKYHPLTVITWVFTFAMPMVLISSWKSLSNIEWDSFTNFAWYGLGYVILFATFFTYSLNAFAIKILSPVIVGLYLYLQPFLTTLISIQYEKDTLDIFKVIAGILIFSGLYLSTIRRKPLQKNH